MEISIRRALPTDALFLTSISFGAKRYWNYPEEYYEIWHDELTITKDYIEQNIVYVAQKKDTIIGYFSIVEVSQEYWNGDVFIRAGYWLDHMYIRPAYIRNGIGTELMEYAEDYCRENGIEMLYILSDPLANGFYEKMGADYIKECPSSIKNRTVSLFEYYIPEKSRAQLEAEEEEERLRQEEEAERLRQEEEAERLRQEAEEAERLSQEAEEAEKLKQEEEETERLRQEAEEERLRQEEREEQVPQKKKRKTIFSISREKKKHKGIVTEYEKLEDKFAELDQEIDDEFSSIDRIGEATNLYEIDEDDTYSLDQENDDEEYDEEDYDQEYDDEEYDEDDYDQEYELEADDEDSEALQIPGLQLDEAEIAALINPNLYKTQESEVDKENEVNDSGNNAHIRTEKEKMLAGELYIAWGDEFINDKRRARNLLKEFNNTDVEDKKAALKLLKELLGSTGEYIHIEPNFRCDYGYNIHIGDNFYAGYDCVILDSCKVTIGDNCILSPQVGIYTSTYPLNPDKRIAGYEYAKPITIGNNVWIGGGAIINPGVTIGDNVVVAPGSVVLMDIPNNVLVGGNPAKIIKELDDEK